MWGGETLHINCGTSLVSLRKLETSMLPSNCSRAEGLCLRVARAPMLTTGSAPDSTATSTSMSTDSVLEGLDTRVAKPYAPGVSDPAPIDHRHIRELVGCTRLGHRLAVLLASKSVAAAALLSDPSPALISTVLSFVSGAHCHSKAIPTSHSPSASSHTAVASSGSMDAQAFRSNASRAPRTRSPPAIVPCRGSSLSAKSVS